MHLSIILVVLTAAWWLRSQWEKKPGNWLTRWQQTLSLFLFPPLLILATAIALLCMGPTGKMAGWQTGWFSYGLGLAFVGWTAVIGLNLVWEGWQTIQQIRTYPQIQLGETPGRLLKNTFLFCGRIGFWKPELVVSEGLLATLNSEQLEAVLAHEQGHYYYRDTFWFFWLGWLKAISKWLPNTEALWQELLLLRELRADQWAAQQVDSLLLAESLLLVAIAPIVHSDNFCAPLSTVAPSNRLEERIEALISQPENPTTVDLWFGQFFLLSLLPLLTILFHG